MPPLTFPTTMTNWFYYDSNGQKQGLITDSQLINLVAQSVIVPETVLETENGQQGKAKQLKQLTFPQPVDSVAVPPPVPNDSVLNVSRGQCGSSFATKIGDLIHKLFLVLNVSRGQGGSSFATNIGDLIHNLFLLLLTYLARTLIHKLIYNLFLAYLAVITLLVFTPALTLSGGIVLGIVGYIVYRSVLVIAAIIFPDLFEPAVIRPLLKAARQGGAEAKVKLGQYYYGQGEDYSSKKEFEKAINCYEKAAKYGLDDAKKELADCWYAQAVDYSTKDGKENRKKQYDCTRKSAEAGHAMANVYMGDYYLHGSIYPLILPNGDEAVMYWKKAIDIVAEQGDTWLNVKASDTARQRLEELAAVREQEVIAKRREAMGKIR